MQPPNIASRIFYLYFTFKIERHVRGKDETLRKKDVEMKKVESEKYYKNKIEKERYLASREIDIKIKNH